MLIKELIILVNPKILSIMTALVLGIGTIVSSLSLIGFAAYLISMAALRPGFEQLYLAIVAVRFFGIAKAIFRYGERYVAHQATFEILTALRVWCYEKLEPLVPAKLKNYHSGKIFNIIVKDIEILKDFYLRIFAPIFIALSSIVVLGLFLSYYSLTLALLTVLFLLVLGCVVPILTHYYNKNNDDNLAVAQAGFNIKVLDIIAGLAEIKSFSLEQEQFEKLQQNISTIERIENKTELAKLLLEAISSFWMGLLVMASLFWCGYLVNEQMITGVTMVVLVLVIQSSFEIIAGLPAVTYYWRDSYNAAIELWSLLKQQPEIEKQYGFRLQAGELVVKNLSFAYDDDLILRNINFTVAEQQHLAIVGASGSGKTTLINLLLKFLHASSGKIMLSGIDYTLLSSTEILQKIAVVEQETHLFNDTLAANLLIAKTDATTAELLAVLKLAQLYDFVQSLPKGLETELGENGKVLSGGQRQRVALARALLKNAQIVILDEPTTGLDPENANAFMQVVQEVLQNKTVIIISLVLATLRSVDEIIVLKDGDIWERGTYAELSTNGGLFSAWLGLQT